MSDFYSIRKKYQQQARQTERNYSSAENIARTGMLTAGVSNNEEQR
jgi:hypothetical protein